MGIRGLEDYILTCHEPACPVVDLKKIVDEYLREHPEKNSAVAVFDASFLLRHLYKGLQWYGAEFQAYKKEVEAYVHKFREVKIEPHFYFDGDVEVTKRRTWIGRKQSQLKNIKVMYENLESGRPITYRRQDAGRISRGEGSWRVRAVAPGPSVPVDPRTRQAYKESKTFELSFSGLPEGLWECLILTLKELDVEVKTAEGDGDLEIARYARDKFAIVSRDTDFIPLRGAKYYLSAYHLDLEKMTTRNFSREAIAASLEINTEHLPLLCALLPNDWVDFKFLEPLHATIMGRPFFSHNYSELIPELVKFMKEEVLIQVDHVACILSKTFGDVEEADEHRLFKEQLQTSLNMHDYTIGLPQEVEILHQSAEISADEVELTRERHARGEFLQAKIHTLLRRKELNMSPGMEDPRLPRSCSSEIAMRPLRQRIYGLLLLQEPVKEWYLSCTDQDADIQPTLVEAEFPDPETQPHPGLDALWSSSDEDVEAARWRLFAWALAAHQGQDSPVKTLDEDLQDLNREEPELVMPTAMMYALYHSSALEEMGEQPEYLIRVLARTCLETMRMRSLDVSLRGDLSRLDKVRVHLSAVMMASYTLVSILNDALGKPIHILMTQPALFFNGVVLHKLRMEETVSVEEGKLEDRIVEIACRKS